MSEHLHPGVHPDVDTLSAFVEGVLPEHERAQCLAHLAECSRCRDVVFLARDTQVAPAAPELVPRMVARRWLRPMPILAAAAAVCVIFFGAWLFLRSRTGPPPRELVAQVRPEPPSTAPVRPAETPAPQPFTAKTTPRVRRRVQPEPKPEPATLSVTVPEIPRTTPPAPAAVPAEPTKDAAVTPPQVNTPPTPKPPAVVVEAQAGPTFALSVISGTVTDESGATVPAATVQLRQLATNKTNTTQTDQSGEFKFADLAPGRYELQIDMRGFRRIVQQVELQPQEVAALKPRLQVGSTTETVEVMAASSTVNAETAQLSNSRRKRASPTDPRPLPSKLPAEITATSDKMILAVDSAGALFFSGNSGKGWKSVKPQWTGKIESLTAPPELPDAGRAKFQLTTDSDADWLSRDGRHWYPAPRQH